MTARQAEAIDVASNEATSFIGRKAELETAGRVLVEARLLTITGPRGVGKSRFAAKLAERMARTFADAPVRLDLRTAAGPALAAVSGLRTHAGIVLLDDADDAEVAAGVADRIHADCPRAVVVVTGTARLGLDAEHVLALSPFVIPSRALASSRVILDYEVVRLLVDRIRMSDPAFVPTTQELRIIRDLCAATDGLPALVELAAVAVRLMSLESIRDALHSSSTSLLDLLPEGERILATAEEVWQDGDDDERALLGVAAALREPVTLDCLVSLVDGVPGSLVRAFGRLVDRSVLLRDPDVEGGFRLLRAMRHRGRKGLEESGAVEGTTARIDAHLIALMRDLADAAPGATEVQLSHHLMHHRPSLERLLSRYVHDPDTAAEAIRLIVPLRKRWSSLGLAEQVQAWLEQAVVSRRHNDALAAEARRTIAYYSIIGRDFQRSAELLAECGPEDESEQEPGDLPTEFLRALTRLGAIDAEGAEDQLEAVVERSRTSGRIETLDEQMYFLTLVAVARGDHERAEQLFRSSVELMIARGNRWGVAYALVLRSISLFNRGLDEPARETTRKALAMLDALGDRAGVPTCLRLLAALAHRDGDTAKAATLLAAASRMHGSRTFARDVIGWGLEEKVRRTLGSREFSRLSARGRQLDRRSVLALALDDGETGRADELTPREFEIAELLVEGLSSAEIAARLVLSTRTVEGHIQRMLHKLQFRSRSQIAVWMSKRLDGLHVLAS
jgi:non-specific serine/threonine protein kinase